MEVVKTEAVNYLGLYLEVTENGLPESLDVGMRIIITCTLLQIK